MYSRVVSPTDFRLFLNWANKYLWKKSPEVTDKKFHKICKKFYLDKTITRTEKLFEKKNLKDSVNIINGEKVPSIKDILEKIDFNKLSESSQTQFHGDLILDNIIKNSHSGYKLIDWRQDFGGLLESGDLYYDLAKLNHNLTLNHDIINSNQFTINSQNNYINVDIMRKENLVSCQEVLYRFIIDNGYDINKVKLLTAIIWLNMSPLHSHPLDLFLFYFGKLYLWRLVR